MSKIFLIFYVATLSSVNTIICIIEEEKNPAILKKIESTRGLIHRELTSKEVLHITKIKGDIEYKIQNDQISIDTLRPLFRGYIIRKGQKEALTTKQIPEELLVLINARESLLVPLAIQIIIESNLLSVKDKKTLLKALQEREITQSNKDLLKFIEKYFLNKLPKEAFFKGLSTPIPNKKENSSLHLLANIQEQEINVLRAITSYLSEPINWDVQNETGDTPLHAAASKKNIPFIEFLLEKGANITKTRQDGKTPLLKLLSSNLNLGIRYENLPKLTKDIKGKERRALKELKTKQETQKLINIIERDGILHQDAIPLLSILAGATLNNLALTQKVLTIPSKNGWTPLHYAAAYHSPEIVRLFIQLGSEIEPLDNNGRTPLHVAAERGRTFNAQVLIQEGHANPETQDHKRRRPLDLVDSKIGQIFSSGHNKASLYYSSTLESLLLIEKVMRGTFEWGNLDPNKWWLAPWVEPWVLTIDFSDETPVEPSDGHIDDEFNE